MGSRHRVRRAGDNESASNTTNGVRKSTVKDRKQYSNWLVSVVLVLACCCVCCVTTGETEVTREEKPSGECEKGEIKQVTVGYLHTCKLATSGKVSCEGESNAAGQLDAPEGQYEKISAGVYHTCGLKTSGEIACWGLGQEPDGASEEDVTDDRIAKDEGQAAAPDGKFIDVDAGREHTCGVTDGGRITCWGDPDATEGIPEGSFEKVSAGNGATCGLTENGTIRCWDEWFSVTHSTNSDKYVEVEVGNGLTCGRTSQGKAHCWAGFDEKAAAKPTITVTELDVRGWDACGIQPDRTIRCWTAVPDTELQYFSTASGKFRQLSSLGGQRCGVTCSGKVRCWADDYGYS